ncbi:MAG: ketoacyl-ACP synthase III [Eubacterium sp.]|nr:ketoacyl-ACP synthase III [Eubacterium sp.]
MFGKIIGTGSYIPRQFITNEDLTNYIDTSDEWITDRTGVKKRHIMKDETTADMAVEAARKAVEQAGIHVNEIDMIIVSSVSSNVILPNTACYVQDKIGAVNAFCFDINTACTGFIMAYNTAQSYIDTGLIQTALIIGAEGLSKIVDWSDRGTCILFGDGAGAAIIKKDSEAVFDTVMHADGSMGAALTCDNGFAYRPRLIDETENKTMSQEEKNAQSQEGHLNQIQNTYVQMNGQEIFRFAVKQVPECIQELMKKMQINKDEIDMFILHQANSRILQGIAKRLKVSLEKIPMNVSEYGNTSSACIPILLDELFRTGELKEGDKIIMSGFGAGVTLAATYLEV